MNIDRRRIPGIKKIQIVRCRHLTPHVELHSICGNAVAIAAPAQDVPFTGRPLLEWEGERVNGRWRQKSTLTFSSSMELPEDEYLAFVITKADGGQLLIGAKEPNYPVITYTDSTGNPGGEPAIRQYKITHIALKSAVACVL